MNKKFLGIIVARGGSKGIPGKNIKPLIGKPLIAYTIEAAKQSGVFDRLILSTDDEKIAAVARKYGCDVPFLRPQNLAEDNTPTLPVLIHAVKWLADHENYNPDYVVLLQPTAPLRQSWHIKEAADLIMKAGADSVVSFSKIPTHFNPHWIVRINSDGKARLWNGDPIWKRIKRRQDLPETDITYSFSGHLYIFKTSLLFGENPNMYGNDTRPYFIENQYCANIDTPNDWVEADKALQKLLSSNS